MSEALPNRRTFRLTRKVAENGIITSFYLSPEDGKALWDFKAGQFLPIEIPNGAARPLLRTYTISSSPAEKGHYRLTVKREPSPPGKPLLAPGMASNWLHDRFEAGQTLLAHAPRGDFVLDDSLRSVVMLSGGVGLTPMVSMLGDLASRPADRDVWFIHSSRDAASQALGDEVRRLASRHGRTRVSIFHETPHPSGKSDHGCDHSGRVGMDALQQLLPFGDHVFYLCGPGGFMQSLYEGLTSFGVDPNRIRYEFFGPAKVLHGFRNVESSTQPEKHVGLSTVIDFARTNKSVPWSGAHKSILEAAEAAGIDIMHSCREGVCGTCHVRLRAGKVQYVQEPIAYIEDGDILTCISCPLTNVALDA